jgi:Tfp pilus assembly protein PilV
MSVRTQNHRTRAGFTLMEVMIALAIFFAVSFAILGVVSSGLRTAQALRIKRPDATLIAGNLWVTNKLEEGVETGNFGRLYPDHDWRWDAYEITNGFWQVDIDVYQRSDRSKSASQLSIQMYRPQWQTRRLGVQP